jgi:outer membrane protein assembly factor BamB
MSVVVSASLVASEWRQWRGDNRDGVAASSPTLVTSLPAEGLKPVWISEKIASGNDGGWGSPVVADGKVYLFAHTRAQQSEKQLPPRKYPYLADDKRGHLSAAEYAEYEKLRREEDAMRGTFYDFMETVHCLDAATGASLWKNEKKSVYTRFLQSGSPTIVDGKLYILGAALVARAIDADDGKTLWEQKLPGEFTDEFMDSSFAAADGVAVVLAGRLFGLDAKTGELLWQGDEKKTKGTHSSPIIWKNGDKELIVVNVAGEDTICVEPKTGRELWRIKSQANHSTPVIVGNRLLTYGNSRRAGLRCFEISESGAKPAWVYQRIADKGSSPVVVDGYVYVQGERRLACVDLATGEEGWSTLLDLNTPQYTSLVAADRKVFYTHDGVLCVAADPAEYRPLVQGKINKHGLLATEASFRKMLKLDELEKSPDGLEKSLKVYQQEVGNHGPLVCASPAIVDGRLYVRLKQGIGCYDLRAGGE